MSLSTDTRRPGGLTASRPAVRLVHTFQDSYQSGALTRPQLRQLFKATIPSFRRGLPAKLAEDLAGVDYWLDCGGPTWEGVQLKVRHRRELRDVLIEVAHVFPGHVRPGWISAHKPARWFVYAAPAAHKCLAVDGWELRAAWSALGRDWLGRYPVKVAQNMTFCSLSVAVPLAEIQGACQSARVVEVIL